MARKRTIHRGETRGPHAQSDFERRSIAAQRGRATRERREALYATHPRAVVDAGWAKVRDRVVRVREYWFGMLEAKDAATARAYQQLLMDALHVEGPDHPLQWRDHEWAWLWY